VGFSRNLLVEANGQPNKLASQNHVEKHNSMINSTLGTNLTRKLGRIFGFFLRRDTVYIVFHLKQSSNLNIHFLSGFIQTVQLVFWDRSKGLRIQSLTIRSHLEDKEV
jgi:hypothetical protein